MEFRLVFGDVSTLHGADPFKEIFVVFVNPADVVMIAGLVVVTVADVPAGIAALAAFDTMGFGLFGNTVDGRDVGFDANGALLLFFTTNFCIFVAFCFELYHFSFSH